MPVGNRSLWSPRATKVARGRFAGSVSDGWALSAWAMDTVFSHLRAPRMAEMLRSAPLVKAHQGNAAEQAVPTCGAARADGILHPISSCRASPQLLPQQRGEITLSCTITRNIQIWASCSYLEAARQTFARRLLKNICTCPAGPQSCSKFAAHIYYTCDK